MKLNDSKQTAAMPMMRDRQNKSPKVDERQTANATDDKEDKSQNEKVNKNAGNDNDDDATNDGEQKVSLSPGGNYFFQGGVIEIPETAMRQQQRKLTIKQ